MWILSDSGQYTPIQSSLPFILGRGRDGVADNIVISRDHTRIELIPGTHQVRLTQLGRHPIFVYRQVDLPEIGWEKNTNVSANDGGRLARSQLAARSSKGIVLQKGDTETLKEGDAFGISTDRGVVPFWIIRTNPNAASATATPSMPSAAPSLSLTPPNLSREVSPARNPSPPRHTSPSRHVSSASLSPHRAPSSSLVGPVSSFYGSLRSDSVERAIAEAAKADADMHIDSKKDEIELQARLEVQKMLQEEAREKAQQVYEQGLWDTDQYPAGKRRKIIDAKDYPQLANQRAEHLPIPPEIEQRARQVLNVTDASPSPSPSPASVFSPPIVPLTPASSSPSSSIATRPAAAAPAIQGTVPPTLAFAPLSVFECQFSTEKANPLCLSALQSFFTRWPAESHPDIRITMVVPGSSRDNKPADGPAKDVFEFFSQREMDPRFSLRVGDITDLGSLGVRASYLVHSTTWRFVGGEGGRIAKHMQPGFEEKLMEKHGSAKVNMAYVTSVTSDSELAKRCPGINAIISVTPPNMNDAKANSLHGDYMKGCKQLKDAYGAVLNAFEHKLKASERPPPSPAQPTPAAAASSSSTTAPMVIAPANSARAASPAPTAATSASVTAARPVSPACTFVPPESLPPYSKPSGVPKTPGHYSLALYQYIKNPRPSDLQPFVYWEDSEFVAIYDVYPKARIHLLLLPKKNQIDAISKLTSRDIPLIDAMEARAKWISEGIVLNDAEGRRIPIRRGFHAVPSLKLLHLHIISQDFDSPALKNKKHIHSFTTGFFVQPNRLKEMIAKAESSSASSAASAKANFLISSFASARDRDHAAHATLAEQLAAGEKLLTADLRCHRIGCNVRLKTMPDLLAHFALCQSKSLPTQSP